MKIIILLESVFGLNANKVNGWIEQNTDRNKQFSGLYSIFLLSKF